MSRNTKFLSILSLLFFVTILPVRGQNAYLQNAQKILTTGEPRTQLMILGTFHFSFPGNDVHQIAASDQINMLSSERQRQIKKVIKLLSAYQPTKIAVEWDYNNQAKLDSLYQAYLKEGYQLTVNEIDQLGFRLGRQLDHQQIYAVDMMPGDFFQPVFDELISRKDTLDTIYPQWRNRYKKLYTFDDSLAKVLPLRKYYLYTNSPRHIRMSHGAYSVGWFKIKGNNGYLGADFRTAWYNRNLRIFRNLQHITDSAEERILLIIGSGHVPILKFLAQSSPEFQWVEVNSYLKR